MTTGGSSIDAAHTIALDQRSKQIRLIDEQLKKIFLIQERCQFTGTPGGVVCFNEAIETKNLNEAERILITLRTERALRIKQIPPDHKAQRRLALDIAGMAFGVAVSIVSSNKPKKR